MRNAIPIENGPQRGWTADSTLQDAELRKEICAGQADEMDPVFENFVYVLQHTFQTHNDDVLLNISYAEDRG
ncbi:unnamed protein product [Caretta caretta]